MPEPASSQSKNPANPANPAPAGGEPGSSGNQAPPASTPPASTGPAVDLKALPPEQLQQVLENPALWQQPRIKELVEAQRKLKKSDEDAQKANEETLKEQKKFEELAEQRGKEVETLKAKLEQGTINQKLTTALAPLGVVDLEGALALIDRSGIKIDEQGSVAGVDEAIEALKKGKAYLFNASGSPNPTVGTPSNPGNGGGTPGPAKFKRSQLQDQKFYQENRAEILKAQAAGQIEDDITR